MVYFVPVVGAIARYHCNYCQEDIGGVRVKCAECQDFDLCVQCFSCGAEIGTHKNNHKYQIIDCGNLPIFKPPHAWKAKEELMLLESIEQYGFGNWEDVSKHLVNREFEDVKEHYTTMYIMGTIGRATWSVDTKHQVKDNTCPEGGPLSPSLTTPLPPLELTNQETQELGYMPLRDDFEGEYDNDAESLTCNLSVSQEDEDVDIALKLAHVDMYSRRLQERLRRKRIAREYALVSQFFNTSKQPKVPAPKKKTSKEDKDFQEKMQLFAQFESATEHEQFFDNLQREKELKCRIKELIRYRRSGLSKLEECSCFETARCRREKRKENKKKPANSNSTVSSAHRRPNAMTSKKLEEKGSASIQDEPVEDDKKEESKEVDISSLPGYELLSDKEKKLCYSISLKPAYYISFKTVLLKDHLLRKQGNSVKPRYPAGLEKAHRRKIINLLVSSGWIPAS